MIRRALAVSAALHLGAAALLLPWPGGVTPAPDVPMLEVELVQEPDATAGAAPEAAAAAPAPPQPEPPPPGPEGAPAPVPAPVASPARPQATAVNLGNAEQDLEGLVVTGEHVVPPRPDAQFHNKPPRYPRDAGRRGAQGTVGLLVHVSANGAAEDVLVTASSGTESLDEAARDAVLLWRFRPANEGGVAVPFDYPLSIRFVAGTR